jgi:hypothetical protein
MKRLLFTTLLCALGTAHVSAENEVSQQLFDWKEDQRNAAFTDMLWDSNLKCDHVIRTLFTGTFLGVDEWEVLCKDRRSYAISVLGDLDNTIISALSCRDLAATSKRLLQGAGSAGRRNGCRIR